MSIYIIGTLSNSLLDAFHYKSAETSNLAKCLLLLFKFFSSSSNNILPWSTFLAVAKKANFWVSSSNALAKILSLKS